MLEYRVEISDHAIKSLKKLPKPLVAKLLQAAKALKDNPRPTSCKKLKGFEDLYRVRVGDWRIIYTIQDNILLVLIISIKSRGEIYKELQN